jgi:Holliday junction resolvasome RuvABC endonuclease subunit
VAAIDPGSVKAGMVVLQIQPAPPGFIVPDPGDVAVLARATARTVRQDDFATRMSRLQDIIEQWAEHVRRNWQPELWCIEDPRDFTTKQLRGRGAAVSLGAGFGVACAAFSVAAGRCGVDVTLVPAQEWLPKTRTRNLVHYMKHNAARAWLRNRWPALASLTDDETFAAGMALWAHTKGAMAAVYPI